MQQLQKGQAFDSEPKSDTDYFRLLLRYTENALIFLNRDSVVDLCNDWLLKRLGLDMAEAQGLHFVQLFSLFTSQSYVDEATQGLAKVMRDGTIYKMQVRVEYPRLRGQHSFCTLQILPFISGGDFMGARVLVASREIAGENDVQRYHPLLETVPFSCSIRNSNGRMLACNKRFLELFEAPDESDVILNFRHYMPEFQPNGDRSMETALQMYKDVCEKGHMGHMNFEWTYLTHKGEPLPAWVDIVYMRWYDDYLIMTYITDLRVLKQKEEDANKSREWAITMLNSIPLSCMLFATGGVPLDCNAAAVEFFGVKDKQELCERFYTYHPDYQPDGEPSERKARSMIRLAFSTAGGVDFYWEHSVNGEVRPVKVSLRRVYTQERLCVVAYMEDLRLLRQKEAEAEQSREWALAMLNSIPLSCLLFAKDSNMPIDCNTAAMKFFDVQEKRDLCEHFVDFHPIDQPDGESSLQKGAAMLNKTQTTGEADFYWDHLIKGEIRPSKLSLRRVYSNNTLYILAYMEDLRELKQREDEANKSREWALAMLNSIPLPCMLFVKDGGTVPIDCNKAAQEFFDIKEKRDLCERFATLNPLKQPDGEPSDQKAMNMAQQAFASGEVDFYWEHLINGEVRPVKVTLRRVYSYGRMCLLAYMEDLRALKQKEDEANQSREWAITMLNSIPLPCVLFSIGGTVLDCNTAALEFFDVKKKPDLCERFSAFSPDIQPDGEHSVQKALLMGQKTVDTGKVNFYWEHLINDEVRPVNVSMRRVYVHGNPCAVAYMEDLREKVDQV